MVDCDVDAADLHLLLSPAIKERNHFRSGKTAFIDKDKCAQCRKCIELCRYEAIFDDFIVDITKHLKPYGPTNFQLRLTEKGPTVFEINPRFSGTTPIRTMFGINEVEVIVNAVLFGKMPQKIKKKRGIVMRYFENQFVSWEQYREYA